MIRLSRSLHLKAASALALAGVFALIGCLGTDSKDDGTPGSPPVIVTQPADQSLVEGQNATFTVSATGAVSYQWVRNGNDTIAGADSSVFTMANVLVEENGDTFQCVVRNANGVIATRNALLTVIPNPSRAQLLDTGAVLFADNCTGCHGQYGEGGRGPTVANSDYVMGGNKRLIATLLNGVTEPITVNGFNYSGGGMPAWGEMFTDVEIAGISTYLKAALNDSLVTNCVVNPTDEFDVTCTKTARTPQSIAMDSISVLDVIFVRDSLSL